MENAPKKEGKFLTQFRLVLLWEGEKREKRGRMGISEVGSEWGEIVNELFRNC